MIVIAGTARIDPDRKAAAVELATDVARATRAEDGCLTYRFHVDLEDEATIFIFEEWETQAALDAHFETDHMERFQSELPEYLTGPPKIYRYEVTERERFV